MRRGGGEEKKRVCDKGDMYINVYDLCIRAGMGKGGVFLGVKFFGVRKMWICDKVF